MRAWIALYEDGGKHIMDLSNKADIPDNDAGLILMESLCIAFEKELQGTIQQDHYVAWDYEGRETR